MRIFGKTLTSRGGSPIDETFVRIKAKAQEAT
jgi:hypothetical protein